MIVEDYQSGYSFRQQDNSDQEVCSCSHIGQAAVQKTVSEIVSSVWRRGGGANTKNVVCCAVKLLMPGLL